MIGPVRAPTSSSVASQKHVAAGSIEDDAGTGGFANRRARNERAFDQESVGLYCGDMLQSQEHILGAGHSDQAINASQYGQTSHPIIGEEYTWPRSLPISTPASRAKVEMITSISKFYPEKGAYGW